MPSEHPRACAFFSSFWPCSSISAPVRVNGLFVQVLERQRVLVQGKSGSAAVCIVHLATVHATAERDERHPKELFNEALMSCQTRRR